MGLAERQKGWKFMREEVDSFIFRLREPIFGPGKIAVERAAIAAASAARQEACTSTPLEKPMSREHRPTDQGVRHEYRCPVRGWECSVTERFEVMRS